jgi:effector-binding domain-containing protein
MDIMNETAIEIKLVKTKDTSIVSVREKTAISNIDELIAKAYNLLNKTGARCLGAPYAIYHSPFFDPGQTDVEIGFPVSPSSNYTRVLAGCTCAMGLHKGDFSNMQEAFLQVIEWIECHGYTISGMPFERYLNNPHEVPPEKLLAEVYFPIEE